METPKESEVNKEIVLIYEAFYLDVAQDRINGDQMRKEISREGLLV